MTYDVTVVRPEMREEQIKARGRALSAGQRRAVRGALRTLHALEIMAVKIYQCQITKDATPLNTALTNAMSNELTHMQDFQTRLYEYGFTPAKLRGRFWMVGYVFGLSSRMMGTDPDAQDRYLGGEQGCRALWEAARGRRLGRRDQGYDREGPGGRIRSYRSLGGVPQGHGSWWYG